MNALITRYDHTAGQLKAFSVVADELNRSLLNTACKTVMQAQRKNGWEVVMQL